MGDMTDDFSRYEFKCNCGCGLDKIDPKLVGILQNSRSVVGIVYSISSGCRCFEHNRKVGGKDRSAHLPFTDGYCHAADIECNNSHEMFLIGADLIRLVKRIEFGKKVNKEGRVKLWIHVDNRLDLPQEVLFLA